MTIVQSQDAKLRRTAIMPRAQVRARLGVMVGKTCQPQFHRQSFIDTKVQTGGGRAAAVAARALAEAAR